MSPRDDWRCSWRWSAKQSAELQLVNTLPLQLTQEFGAAVAGEKGASNGRAVYLSIDAILDELCLHTQELLALCSWLSQGLQRGTSKAILERSFKL